MTADPGKDAIIQGDPAALAVGHNIAQGRPAIIDIYRALPVLDDWLEDVRKYCAHPASEHARAADWLLDNDYHIARALRRVREDLPPDFYRQLAALDAAQGRVPRIYALAEAIFDDVRPQITLPSLIAFIRTYQEHADLTNAELWALPSMLRLVCIERLIDAFGSMNDTLLPKAAHRPEQQRISDEVQTELIAQAITNLIAIHGIKWTDFVDLASRIEAILASDPAGVYADMTFETRDRYRSAVERLARRCDFSEVAVAHKAVAACHPTSVNISRSHVGYWLIGDGLAAIETELGYRAPRALALRRRLARYAGTLYAAGLVAGVLIALIVPLAYLWMQNANFLQWLLGTTISVLPATILSVWVVHWIITKITRPETLPELDFSKSIPGNCATAIIVPVIVGSEVDVEGIIEKLEILHLANPDPALRFVLLSDPVDAPTQTVPEDEPVQTGFKNGIALLNARYGKSGNAPFVLLHRGRQFNAAEGCWMAWERKRGKLEEFNQLILGEKTDAFSVVEGDIKELSNLRYAITLDADTQLPPGVATRLIGILAHPLNRAEFDPESGRVVSGYAILQPRIEILPKLGKDTHFSHLYGGDTAVDIYSRAVSDVYQDLFGTGIFVGKGIYDIAALHRSMAGRVPENRILSHDLFEGLHGRSALASNLVLYEDLPANYPEFALRQHRWIRGDWQLVPWLWRRVPAADGGKVPNPLSALDRWKILDNLRRSLVPPTLLLFFVGAWMALPGSAWVWTLLAVAAPGSYLAGEVFAIATGGIRRGALGTAIHQIKTKGGRWFFSVVFLVSDTVIATDAITRTLWRQRISGRNLLKWTSAANAAAEFRGGSIRSASWRLMWPSSALALLLSAELVFYEAHGFLSALPVLLLWFLAPEIAVWSARSRLFSSQSLDDGQRRFLIQVARRTWHFFETFVGPDDNWLPPDNYQHNHHEEIAHRTSPTNIGMFLVSALAARDMGFITTNDFLTRSRNSVDTLGRMTMYRGHILNWYETRTLEPLEPQYVSTVDSGNLAVSLIALKHGCLELADQPAIGGACFGCLSTTFDLLVIAIHELQDFDEGELNRIEWAIRTLIDQAKGAPLAWKSIIAELNGSCWLDLETLVRDAIQNTPDALDSQIAEITTWLDRYQHDLHAIGRDIDGFMPWLSVIAAAPPERIPLAEDILKELQPANPKSKTAVFEKITARLESCDANDEPLKAFLTEMQQALQDGFARQAALRDGLIALADQAEMIAYGMDFAFLYDPTVRLFTIGYNHSLGQMDNSHYDLLATEARLASYFAIAKHDAPVEHWFSLSRPITRLQGKPSILSWNGSMFEYLMPPLFLPSYRDTLLGESELTAVEFQRAYARERGVPWGISESAFGVTDAQGTYQYRAFGVPGLGIRRGLTEDIVIAPYGSALALCGWPEAAVENLKKLAGLGAMTRYGFFDALDFTPDRLAPNRDFIPVQNYMAHHQGMIMAAIVNATADDVMVRRFLREKSVHAMDLLLQERVPWDLPLERGRADEAWEHHAPAPASALAPWAPSSDLAVPQIHLLGNGRMSSLITETGGGGLKERQSALTRWQPDPTRTAHGLWFYLRDTQSGEIWSLGAAPAGRDPGQSSCVFHQHMVELLRRNAGIVARMDITVAPFDDVEIRRVTLVNESDEERTIDLTSYAEVVLAPPLDDERHPAFSKLFVQSSYLEQHQALLFQRRPRRPEIRPPVLLHKVAAQDPTIQIRAWDTDRGCFMGRNRSDRSPKALFDGLTETAGWTLDPVMALQVRVHLKPMETKELTFLTVAGNSREDVVGAANRYPALRIDRAFRDAHFESGRVIQQLEIDPVHLPELQVLSSLLIHFNHTLRGAPSDDPSARIGQPDLWRFGISGDLPILLLKVAKVGDPSLLDVLVRAQRLWHRSGLDVDLVVLRDAVSGYEEPLREQVLSILRDTRSDSVIGKRGGIHLLAADQMDARLRRGIEAAAHVVLSDDHLTLREMLDQALETRLPPPRFDPGSAPAYDPAPELDRPSDLLFDNGYGGFDRQTGDYLIHLAPGIHTPAPWCNVLANDDFGCLVSEAGFGTSWSINAGEHRLTPWSNDPVANTPGEAVYLRDEASGDIWTTTPAPIGDDATCQVRHGAGETSWRQNSYGLEQEILTFVPVDASVKLVRLRVTNRSGLHRRISATYYAEWLLGALGSVARPHVTSHYDDFLKAIIARNKWNPEFGDGVAFLTASAEPHSVTGDRHDFLGRDGSVHDPDGLRRWDLGGRFTSGGGTCAAYQVHLDIAADETVEVIFALGEAANESSLATDIRKWKDPAEADRALHALRETWQNRLGAVQVQTPDPAFDLMVNRWLPYQNRSCRIMARAGFYQAGGAYGFRDQLQDVLALLHTDPERAREHILLAACYQFEAGDVLHWWHPPAGRGVRTHCSDDYLWLAFVTARYIAATDESGILDVRLPFLTAPELRPDEHDRYALFDGGEILPLYDHCARALDRMMATGAHGLPLMGAGDWNDGMDRIGEKGRGESVWLAWFQIATVSLFVPLARSTGHSEDATRWESYAADLRRAVSEHAWDGDWYVRAFDDEGLPWGVKANDECQIDLIAQAWSVLSDPNPTDRARKALQSARERLVDTDARLIRLLTPPFDQTDRDPGYIQAYPPEIRENGAQYTHAATWLGVAYVALGDGDRAYEVFDIINPIRRAADTQGADHYKREPFVLAGDVSGASDRVGQGGWSWYTGAAGWTWQLGLEGILGIKPKAGGIRIAPCLPTAWRCAQITLDGYRGRIDITIERDDKVDEPNAHVTVDGQPVSDDTVQYPGKGKTRQVVVKLAAVSEVAQV
ncbi:GH36-type glycosyl hydrolase domain-containing protein [Yoonia sp. R2-816]|uniref:GH36-type glycosyl hydrolase domain-containing protein n=1 Tax=Yoonia sp. R2-816 TaxID=3342638 RepID=UPI003726B652